MLFVNWYYPGNDGFETFAKLDLTKIYLLNLISTSTLLSCINCFHWWGISFSLILYLFSSSSTYLYIAFICIYILLNSFEYATLIFFLNKM